MSSRPTFWASARNWAGLWVHSSTLLARLVHSSDGTDEAVIVANLRLPRYKECPLVLNVTEKGRRSSAAVETFARSDGPVALDDERDVLADGLEVGTAETEAAEGDALEIGIFEDEVEDLGKVTDEKVVAVAEREEAFRVREELSTNDGVRLGRRTKERKELT